MNGNWIWVKNAPSYENQHACFGTSFSVPCQDDPVTLQICAVTRYIAYLNGEEIGRGPIRSGKDELYFDTWSLDHLIREGENHLAVRVWDYGMSTYQTIYSAPGLIFQIQQNKQILAESDETVHAAIDTGHLPFVPKRNVNLGFTDYYDARNFDANWYTDPSGWQNWPNSVLVEKNVALTGRPIRNFNVSNAWPEHIVSIEQAKKGGQQLTINTRRAFFGDRRDADETIFSGFMGCEFESPADMDGRISFPNRTWNGLIGDFRIDDTVYPVSNTERDIELHLSKGRHFFLIQFSAKYDDLYCHLELLFPQPLTILAQDKEQHCFFTVGPTQRIIPVIDGYARVYGGLNEFNRMEEETPVHLALFACTDYEAFMTAAADSGLPLNWIDPAYVMEDSYLLSLARMDIPVTDETISSRYQGILWNNQHDAILPLPDQGDYIRMTVDFGDVYVGSFDFTVNAPAGTIIDVFCYENMYGREIDYTAGLSNGFRYICKDGWQRYRGMARIGARYALITIRNAKKEVRIRDFHIRHMTYPATKRGGFACDDFQLNRIYQMCCRTHELCLEDSFTDSPMYEQAFWIGDAQLSALTNAYVYGDYDLIRHVLKLSVTASANTPLFNALTPTDWNTNIPMWTMNWIIAISQYIEVTGDDTILDELYEKVKAVLLYYEGFVQEDGGFLIYSWNMLDWANLDIDNLCVVCGQQAILSWCYELGARFALEKGCPEEAAHFRNVRRKLLQYIDEKMWSDERKCFVDGWTPERGLSTTVSIQAHVFLCLYDAILDPEKKKIAEAYVNNPPAEFATVGSPFMLYYLYETMNKNGRSREVKDDICRRWGEMLHYDTTTCWEVFPGFFENGRTRSYCHAWSSTPAVFCLEYILGIKRAEKGWKKAIISVPDYAGNWCRGGVPTPYGTIRAYWERSEKVYHIWAPEEITIETDGLEDWNVIIHSQKDSFKM